MNDLSLLIPEFLVAGLAFLVLGVDLFLKEEQKHNLAWLTAFCLVGILVFTALNIRTGQLYDGLLVFDNYTAFFRVMFLAVSTVVVLMSRDYVKAYIGYPGEYYGILVFTVTGAMLLASSAELLTAYISLELLSFGLYVLVSFDRYNPKSNEGGTKYILLGAFSSALILFGISQIYGLLGTTRFEEIGYELMAFSDPSMGLVIGFVLLISGLGFKLAIVPFHMWAPDVYEGAPFPVTAWLSIGSKAAALALVLRLLVDGFVPAPGVDDWQLVLVVLAALTMVIGNLSALVQKNVRRLLAYSSIGHVGYLLMGAAALVSVREDGSISTAMSHLVTNGIIFHIVAYGVTNLAAFTSLIAVYNHTGRDDIAGLAGLSARQPLVALVLVSSMFSLAGLPVFAGFASKFYLFNAVGAQGLLWLVALAILSSLISLYYYLMVARQIYIEKANDQSLIIVPTTTKALLLGLLILMVVGGIYPAPLMEVIQSATDAIISGELVRLV